MQAMNKRKIRIKCWGACVPGVTRCGINYATARGERRAEEGDVVDDYIIGSVRWLIADGHAEYADDAELTGSRDARAAAIEAHKALVAAGYVAPVEPVLPLPDLSEGGED